MLQSYKEIGDGHIFCVYTWLCINTTAMVEMFPSPDDKREDESLRQSSYVKRYSKAAEQESSILGDKNKRKDLIGPSGR